MINIGIIGYGYWGPNLVRNFEEANNSRVTAVSDLNSSRLHLAGQQFSQLELYPDYSEIINDPEIGAVAIATPVHTHFEIALAALNAGKHVLVEKPMTQTVDQARILIDEASRRNLTLMVDHTFIYTGAVKKIKSLVESGDLGKIYYYDSTRINLGLFQHDVNVIWDLAVHDISILDHILGERAVSVSATGANHVPGAPENISYLTLYFESGTIAHINVNWLSPVKIRQTLIGGSKKMIVYDDIEPTEKIKIYDKGITMVEDPNEVYKMLVGYRTGDMLAPQIETSEALLEGANHFIECINSSTRPITDGEIGLGVVEIAAAATKSMKQQGRPVLL